MANLSLELFEWGRPPFVKNSPEIVARQDSNSEIPIAFGSVSENFKTYNLRKGRVQPTL